MIYVVISDGINRQSELINKKWDCRVLRQPQSLLTDRIKKYIESTKKEEMKIERSIAYTALLCSFEEFFGIKNPIIEKNQNGKPYLLDKDIYFSLSHCDGVAAVALSDESEIGVDIQAVVDSERAKRIESRFLPAIELKNEKIDINYFYMTFEDNKALFYEINPEKDNNSDFLSKWVFAESVIKCFGLTFSEISKINEFSKNTKTQTVCLENYKIAVTIANLKA